MRHYPRNSPEAAARLLALCMVADGHVCRSEVEALRRVGIEAELGLPADGLGPVLQTLCEDLLSEQTCGSLSACIDDSLLEALLRDVDDPALRRKVIDAMAATATADGHLSDGEQQVLQAIQRDWQVDWQSVLARQPLTARA